MGGSVKTRIPSAVTSFCQGSDAWRNRCSNCAASSLAARSSAPHSSATKWYMRSDAHDRSEGGDTLDRVIQHNVARLNPTVGLEWIRVHPKHPIRKYTEAGQEMD